MTDGPVIGIVIYDGCDELDAIGPANVLFAVEAIMAYLPPEVAATVHPPEVRFVSEHGAPIRSANGVVLTATHSYDTCGPLDVVIVAGGIGGRDGQCSHEPTLEFLGSRAEGASIVASVCTGTFVLAGAGLLDGRRANTHWAYRDELAAFVAARDEEVTVVAERVVTDGELMTCGGVSSGIDLAVEIARRLYGDAVADGVAMAVERQTPAA